MWLSVCLFVSLRAKYWVFYLWIYNGWHYNKHFHFLPINTRKYEMGFLISLFHMIFCKCWDCGVFVQTARTQLLLCESLLWKSTCFYKSPPLRNTCAEHQAHCFFSLNFLSCIVKTERQERRHQAGLLNHSSFWRHSADCGVPVRDTPPWVMWD